MAEFIICEGDFESTKVGVKVHGVWLDGEAVEFGEPRKTSDGTIVVDLVEPVGQTTMKTDYKL